jgi:hypothetical protein
MANADVIKFIQEIAPIIVEEGSKRGYHIFSTVIAQAIIESNHGQSKLSQPPNYNFFGLKCGTAWLLAGKPSVNMKTNEEFTIGKLTQVNAYFRRYSSMADGVKGYYDFIATKRYANLKDAVTYKQYAEYLKADGYATSSSYVSTLCKTVETYGLIVYDTGGSIPQWEVGRTYITTQDLNVRREPNGAYLPFDELTENAKKHAKETSAGNAVLLAGTQVTVKEIRMTKTCTWLRIPSGWICGKNSKNTYVI